MLKLQLTLIAVFIPLLLFSQTETNSLLKELDATIDNHKEFRSKKETEIKKLIELQKITSSDIQKYEIYEKLFGEYRFYQSDSAISYARKSMRIANQLNDLSKINTTKLNLASIMGTLGMYKEATDILNKINIKATPELKGNYYGVCSTLYLSMSDFAATSQEKTNYIFLTKKYRESSYNF